MSATTLFDKIWAAHEVAPDLVYIDLHLVHEVTSPQAFDGLRLNGRTVRRRDRTLATADHNVPTDGTPVAARIHDELSRVQVETLERNCAEFGVPVYSLGSDRRGIVHIIGPELGVTQPGMTIVCGDSHTATHGAFGALAFGIGTSEVEHVLATQTLQQTKPRAMVIRYEGDLGLRCWSVCVASTCSTSLVPMPNASAPKAPCVEVCESPHTIVIPGCVTPSSGPITWTIPWRAEPIE